MPKLEANQARFAFEVDGCGDELRVAGFTAHEAVSSLFEVSLELAVENPELDFEQIVGKPGKLKIIGEEEDRYINGIVSAFEQISVGTRFSTYHAVLVPAIWYLGHRYNSRIFQEKNVKDIVEKILKDFGLPSDQYQFNLQNNPPPREYCVQYRESELNFIQRLLEEEGIFYYFEHTEDKHILIMGDNPSAHKQIPGNPSINYHPPNVQVADEEYIFNFQYRETVRPGKVTLKDFNFKKPSLDVKGEKTADKNTNLEVYDYHGDMSDPNKEPGRATGLAKVRLEEQRALTKRANGSTVTNRLCAGFLFTLAEHPRESLNQKYILIRVQISAQQPQVYEQYGSGGGSSFSMNFECQPFDLPLRPARVTPKPVVEGSQTAIVTGPANEEIYTDEHGRVKVQFHWDREGKRDEKSSCWIRVSQVWAGQSWGAIYIPRIGHEVIVDFLEGDPDQPIITGRVYHGTNKPPYPLPAEKTKSTIKSNSSKGGNGFNELRFEDKKRQEEVYLQAEKDWNSLVKNNRSATIGANDTLTVGANRTKMVGANETNTIGKNRTTTVAEGNDVLSIGSNRVKNIGGTETVTIQGGSGSSECKKEDPGKAIAKGAAIGATIGVGLMGGIGALAGAATGAAIAAFKEATADKGSVSRKVTIVKGDDVLTLQEGSRETTQAKGDDKTTLQDGSRTVVIAQGNSSASSPNGLNQITSKDIKIQATNSILMQCGAGSISIDAAGNIQISGPTISINGTELTDIKAPLVKINS